MIILKEYFTLIVEKRIKYGIIYKIRKTIIELLMNWAIKSIASQRKRYINENIQRISTNQYGYII